ncbi:hypothetical protein ALC60_14112 [Trachymyrmex zeteki]|uniref:Uncharacterized protein n=1 Tax=Mycetomoellerius zeteki TaxID=64791 RepID=A0A151WGA3_9HYME|nr:hypothetical protein ALC60_14112 [Trachymyrmex zeteki]
MKTMGMRIGRNAVQFAAQNDSQRCNQANVRAQHATREARISRRLAKNHQMEANFEQEGSLYGPGIDDNVCRLIFVFQINGQGEIIVTAESCVACTADYMTVKWRDFPTKLLLKNLYKNYKRYTLLRRKSHFYNLSLGFKKNS